MPAPSTTDDILHNGSEGVIGYIRYCVPETIH